MLSKELYIFLLTFVILNREWLSMISILMRSSEATSERRDLNYVKKKTVWFDLQLDWFKNWETG